MLGGGAKAMARCDTLGVAPFSDEPDMLFRAYLTPAHRAALEQVTAWMAEAGMCVRLDPAANLIGHYAGSADGPALLIGSHIDSVRDGGRYDGPLGIMLGIECVAALHATGRRLRFPIEVIAFGDEEGSRFPASMLTSRALAGTLEAGAVDVADRDGITVVQALASFHTGGDFEAARHAPALAYLEAHIEQGPVLEAEGLALGVVTGIAAQLRFRAIVTGIAGHAGTTAMSLRADALAGAAEMVLAIEHAAAAGADGLVATVGRMQVAPGAPNVVPGRVEFTIDVRSGDQDARDAAAAAIRVALEAIAVRRGLGLALEQVQDLAASPCDPALIDLMTHSIEALGLPARRITSGAGHDAMVMAGLCPTAMLFIRCEGGISHNPAEAVTADDCELALQAMLGFIDGLAARHAG